MKWCRAAARQRSESAEAILRDIPFFRTLDRLDVGRLLGTPNQSDFCRLMNAASDGELFTARHATIVGITITLVTLIAIGASIPYWQALGLVGR
jgi:hypothetical protein